MISCGYAATRVPKTAAEPQGLHETCRKSIAFPLGEKFFKGLYSMTFGLATDVPAPADYDGDGRADIAVWRDSNQTFYSINSGNSQSASSNFANFVTSGTVATPVSSDYDGDGRADYAIRNAANWIILNSATSVTSVTSWQLASDTPVQNDYDGDGRCDIAVWRPIDTPTGTLGHWFIRQSATGNSLRQVAWGTTGDIPVPAYYRR